MTTAQTVRPTVLEAIAGGMIRTANGHEITREKWGSARNVKSLGEITQMVSEAAAEYAGAVFVGLDDRMPEAVPLESRADIWAKAVCLNFSSAPVGCLIIWTTADREAEYRATKAPIVPEVSWSEFQSRRAGE